MTKRELRMENTQTEAMHDFTVDLFTSETVLLELLEEEENNRIKEAMMISACYIEKKCREVLDKAMERDKFYHGLSSADFPIAAPIEEVEKYLS